MDLVKLLAKLQTIGVTEAEDKQADKDYDGDGKVESEKDEVWGSRMKAATKSKANEDIENVLRGLAAIQEGEGKCPDCGEVHEGECSKSKMDECGDMEMSPLTAPDAGIEMQPMSAIQAAMAQEPEQAPAEVEAEESPRYTLSIQNGDSNLNMTTDVPDEIIHIMKLAGVEGKAEVKAAPTQDGEKAEKEVEEAWGNTPAATNEKEPKAYGDIRDWALKGTGKGQEGSASRKPFGSGDNPMSESAMFEEYKKFKAGK